MTDAELESLGRSESKRLNMKLRHDPDDGYGWEYDDATAEVIESFDFLDTVYDDPAEAFRDFGEFIAGCRAACGFDAIRDATLEEAAEIARLQAWSHTHRGLGGPELNSAAIADAIRAKKGVAQ